MRKGQQDSVLYCKETQGAQQALLFCFHVVSRTNFHGDNPGAFVHIVPGVQSFSLVLLPGVLFKVSFFHQKNLKITVDGRVSPKSTHK